MSRIALLLVSSLIVIAPIAAVGGEPHAAREGPLVVTSDSVLHLYHVLFDNALKEIEEEHFFDDLKAICQGVFDKVHDRVRLGGRPANQIESEADQANVAYFPVALTR